MSESEKFTKREWLWIIVAVAVLGGMLYGGYAEKSRQWHIDAIMNGPIRGNTKSRIYQVPTCPNYDSINADNLRLFQTIEEADSAGYRPAQNCGDDDFFLRNFNETEEPDGPDHPGDQQYR